MRLPAYVREAVRAGRKKRKGENMIFAKRIELPIICNEKYLNINLPIAYIERNGNVVVVDEWYFSEVET